MDQSLQGVSDISINDLNTTTVNIYGVQYTVLNANGRDEEIQDPFRIERLPN